MLIIKNYITDKLASYRYFVCMVGGQVKKMKMYMIRHGESEANLNKRHAGWAQVYLTEKGIEQAQAISEIIKDIEFQKIYVSDLIRAIETKENALPNVNATSNELLREICVGELAGKSFDECPEIFGEIYFTARETRDFTFFGGENLEMQRERVRKFMEYVVTQKEESIAVFCHAGTIRCAMEIAQDSEAYIRPINNCGVFLFEYSGSKWTYKQEISFANSKS